MNPFKIIACTLIACTLGCQSSDSVREELVPRAQSGLGDQLVCPEDTKEHDEFYYYVDSGKASWFYGTIEGVEGFTERYASTTADGQEEYITGDLCNYAKISVVVYVRPERTSWDGGNESEVIPVGVWHTSFVGSGVEAQLADDGKSVVWGDGEVRYFPTGARLGVGGFFDAEGIFRASTRLMFAINDGLVDGYEGDSCIHGTLEGYDADELLERARNATKGVAVTNEETFPFASECLARQHDEDTP